MTELGSGLEWPDFVDFHQVSSGSVLALKLQLMALVFLLASWSICPHCLALVLMWDGELSGLVKHSQMDQTLATHSILNFALASVVGEHSQQQCYLYTHLPVTIRRVQAALSC